MLKKSLLILIFIFVQQAYGQNYRNSLGLALEFPNPDYLGATVITADLTYQQNLIGVHAKFGLSVISDKSSHDDFYENISLYEAEEIFGDQRINETPSYLTGALALTIQPSSFISVGLGPSISYTDRYLQYKDSTGILGANGKYWIEDPDGKTVYGLFTIILFLPKNKYVGLRLSYNTNPGLFGIGIDFMI